MTKQYTLIYILLGVLMFAISAFTAAALREANTTYDLEALKAAQTALAQQVADQVAAQESAMAAWALEATTEVQNANLDVDALRRLTCESITQAAVGGGTGTLDTDAVDVCMTGASTTNGQLCPPPLFDTFADCEQQCAPFIPFVRYCTATTNHPGTGFCYEGVGCDL